MSKDFTPKWGTVTSGSDPTYPEHEYRVSLTVSDFPPGVVEVRTQPDHATMGTKYTARFFDGHEVSGPTPKRCRDAAVTYERKFMDRFAWHLYKQTRWGLSSATRDGTPIPRMSETGGPTMIRPGLYAEPSSLVGTACENGCEVAAVVERLAHGGRVGWAGRETQSHIHLWHAPHPDDDAAYIEFHLCEPCTETLTLEELPLEGPGAWEYR